jgi:hypothetical protein
MAQVVSRRLLTVEAQVSPCEICGGRRGTGTGFPRVLGSPRQYHSNVALGSIYHMGGKQQACWWPQFRDIVSCHRHEQQPDSYF